ncbi:VOC family protein [Pandoraea sp. PE-S2R-1]|uniref:VOC family protein n=1 Tax=Pandoraea sp. PE-S2R-1 TaxID=1986994 RepID=UPI000B3FA48A|nr:VOC family protein [Pandoraea sp. PE-S2R-1]
MSVRKLGYVGLNVRDIATVKTIFGRVLGMQARPGGDGTISYRMDARHHRFTFVPGNSDSLAYVGWETDSLEALQRLAETIGRQGHAVRPATAQEKAERAVLDMFWFDGPDGVRTEIAFGGIEDAEPFAPARTISGFRTEEQGLGHVVLGSADADATVKFYRDSLGFSVSDYIHWDVCRATFLHCNARHHSLAVMNPVYGTAAGQLNHVMVQANAMDDVGRAYDIVRDLGIPVVLTLGKHSNDHMTSFYIQTPGGWAIEYGHGAREIDNDWDVKYYDSPRLWGHHLQSPAVPPR